MAELAHTNAGLRVATRSKSTSLQSSTVVIATTPIKNEYTVITNEYDQGPNRFLARYSPGVQSRTSNYN
jgi:hypothetical protein